MEFRILGPLEVLDRGRPVPIRGAKERTLLAILLLHANQVVSSDSLVDELWGTSPPETARKSLQVRVRGLRSSLSEDVLVTRNGGYLLRVEPGELDLHRFERFVSEGAQSLADGDPESAASVLREALVLWRGPPLSEFAYESFAPAIARLEELRVAALELRIEADLASGLDARLVAELTELVAAHPLRERLHAQLMLALYRQGRQAEALDVYRQTRQALADELGIEPGPALQELHRAILRQDPALTPSKLVAAERSILVAPEDGDGPETLVALAESLARRPARELILAQLLPEASDVSRAAARLNERRQELLKRGVAARAVAFTTASRGDDLVRLAVEQDVDLLLLDGARDLRGDVAATVLARAPCDVALHVARDHSPPAGPVVVLFGGGVHDWAAIEVGAWIAGSREAVLKIAGPAQGRERDASRTLASASLAVQRVLGIAAEPALVEASDEAVIDAVADAAIVVAGLPERWASEGLGRTRTILAEHGRPPVLLVRRGLRPGGLAPRESLTRFTWTLGPAA